MAILTKYINTSLCKPIYIIYIYIQLFRLIIIVVVFYCMS